MRKTTQTAIAGLVLLVASFSTPVSAKSSIQNLPDGNYKFCSNPPPSRQVSDLKAGYCFVFRKTKTRIVGNYFDSSTSGEDNVCVTGRLSNNSVTGEGLQFSQGLPNGMSDFSGSRLTNWDDSGYLKVAQAKLLKTYEQTGYSEIHYRSTVLNLSNFSRHNAGTESPPTNCFN